MESRAKLLGHPIHPMLIVLPLGLLISVAVFDGIYTGTKNVQWATVSYWNIAGGIIGGLLAAVFGLWDWLGIPWRTRAKTVGIWHALGNVVTLAVFGYAWYMRQHLADHAPTTNILIIEVAGLLVGAISGWLGGELVDRLGVGVDTGAHLNAPNSLSGRPASDNSAPR